MKKKQHTPGPWKWSKEKGKFTYLEPDVLSPNEIECTAWCEVSKEDARLIEAAPELLASLEECLALIEHNTEGVVLDEKDTARAVIAKARGENA